MLGGILSAAMKGAGEGYATYAKGEMENQQKLDYAQQILKMQEEKDLRVDEITRSRNITDIGRKAGAEAQAKLETAPVNAQADVAGKVAGYEASNRAGLPAIEGQYKLSQVEANAPADVAAATNKGKAEAAGQTAKTNTPGYLKSVEAEDTAKAAGQRSVAAISAAPHWASLSKPSLQSDGEGNFYTVSWDPKSKETKTAQVTGPDGKPLKGPKDLDMRTKMMVESMLADLKTDLDPESRKNTVGAIQNLLAGNSAPNANPSSGGYKEGDVVTLKSGGQGKVVNVNGKLMVQPLTSK